MKRIIFTLILGIAITLGVWYGFKPLFDKMAPQTPKTSLTSATLLNPTKPLIPFSLTDTHNRNFNQHSLLGHWTLLYFGYAQCPNICPRTLAMVTHVWKSLPEALLNNNQLNFVFVSLDPKEDTLQNLKTFLERFHPKFVGVTGDEAVIQNLSKACSIYSWQDPEKQATGPKIIDHSGALLLINPKGHMQAIFSPPHEIPAITQDLQSIILPGQSH